MAEDKSAGQILVDVLPHLLGVPLHLSHVVQGKGGEDTGCLRSLAVDVALHAGHVGQTVPGAWTQSYSHSCHHLLVFTFMDRLFSWIKQQYYSLSSF